MPRVVWPIIIVVVLFAMLGLQMLRVNPPPANTEPQRLYTQPGSLVAGNVEIAGKEFYSNRIDINRRMKLSGTYKTANLRSRVSIVVLKEDQFEAWKNGTSFQAVSQTGLVPGGRVHVVIEPGVYYLLVDNRSSDNAQSVFLDFALE